MHIIDPERAEVAARPSGQIAWVGEPAVYPSTAEGPGTGRLAPLVTSIRAPPNVRAHSSVVEHSPYKRGVSSFEVLLRPPDSPR